MAPAGERGLLYGSSFQDVVSGSQALGDKLLLLVGSGERPIDLGVDRPSSLCRVYEFLHVAVPQCPHLGIGGEETCPRQSVGVMAVPVLCAASFHAFVLRAMEGAALGPRSLGTQEP